MNLPYFLSQHTPKIPSLSSKLVSRCNMKLRGQNRVACWRGPQSRLPWILHHWLCPWLLTAMCSWSHPAILTSEMSYDVTYNLCLFLFPCPLWTTETFSPQIHSSVHFRTKIETVKVKTCGNDRWPWTRYMLWDGLILWPQTSRNHSIRNGCWCRNS